MEATVDAMEFERRLKNLERQGEQVRQILPTLATKEDLRGLATKEELLATKQDLAACKADLEAKIATLATKEELTAAIAPLATRDYVDTLITQTRREVKEQAEETRRHFDIMYERMRDEVKVIAEGYVVTKERVDELDRAHRALAGRFDRLDLAQYRRKPKR
jgi:hypothetical protein